MKVLLITDQHFGVRNDNIHFIEHYKKFYGKIVVPFIKASGIDTVLCLGDTFDKRRSINFMSLEAAKDMWFTPLEEMGVKMHMLVGNHDIYYKNTLRVNAPSELLEGYGNITVYTDPTTITIGGLSILLLPWICDDNREKSLRAVAESSASVAMGHLELNGFEAHPGHMMFNGMDPSTFNKFKKVFSGHYHMKSNNDNIHYLGNPYQLYWNDYGSKRGFHVFDTETLKTTFYRNPFDTFHKLYYNLQDIGLADLKIIEDLSVELENGDAVLETEDTLTLLDNYIDEIDVKVNKSNIKSVMRSLYMEASEL